MKKYYACKYTRKWAASEMRKPVTFRLDSDLLERARRRATADNRSLTNYVETAVLRALEQAEGAPPSIEMELECGGTHK